MYYVFCLLVFILKDNLLEIIILESIYENFNLVNLKYYVCVFLLDLWCKYNSMIVDDMYGFMIGFLD